MGKRCLISISWIVKRYIFLIFILAIMLSGCATIHDPESSQEFNSHQVAKVNPTNTIGQQIITRHHNINGITLWLSQTDADAVPVPGQLSLNIYNDPSSNIPIFSTSISTVSITQFSLIQISFTPLPLSDGDSFFIELGSPDQEIIVHGRLEDCYSGGQAYQNRQPLNADLAFRLSYLYDSNDFTADILKILPRINFIIPLLAVLLIPGYSLVRLFHLNKIFTASEQMVISVGLSLAVIPIIYLYATKTGLNLTLPSLKFIGGLFGLLIIIMWVSDHSYQSLIYFFKQPKQVFQNTIGGKNASELVYFVLLIIILLLAYLVRIVMVRDLATPAWVDSIHHGLITRLILENGALPHSYMPYLDIESTVYHPGFHSTLATFIRLSAMDISQGMLMFGQALNAAMALSVYLLAVTLTRKPTIGLYASLIVSAFLAMPAYYTSWGRYPQLAGLIILPIPIALLINLDLHPGRWRKVSLLLIASIALTGLFLVHYRVAAFIACLLLSWLISELIGSQANLRHFIKINILRFTVLGFFTLLFSSIWLVPFIQDTFLPRITPLHADPSQNLFGDFSWHYLTPVFGKQIMVLAAAGVFWGLLNRRRIASIMSLWVVFLFFLANLDALNLPGGSFINNSSVAIMLFMPLSVMAGCAIENISALWEMVVNPRYQKFVTGLLFVVMFLVAILGSQQIISILNPTTLLSRQADLDAISWIDHNIPDDETILINSFAWGYGIYAGSDGGAWIPALAGNPTIPPPVLYGLGSQTSKDYINQISQEVIRLGGLSDELWKYLTMLDIEYIYIGARGGLISADALSSSTHFELLYQQENTWLFHLLP